MFARAAIVVVLHAALVVLLLVQIVSALAEPHGYSGLAIPFFGGPAVLLILCLVAWSLGGWVPLVLVDSLLTIWGFIRLAANVPMSESEIGRIALGWFTLAFICTIAAVRLRPRRVGTFQPDEPTPG